jgi:hypothetical protein
MQRLRSKSPAKGSGLTVATRSDKMVCKVKSWLAQIMTLAELAVKLTLNSAEFISGFSAAGVVRAASSAAGAITAFGKFGGVMGTVAGVGAGAAAAALLSVRYLCTRNRAVYDDGHNADLGWASPWIDGLGLSAGHLDASSLHHSRRFQGGNL